VECITHGAKHSWRTIHIFILDHLTNIDQAILIGFSRLDHSPMLTEDVAAGFLFNQTSAIDQTHPWIIEDTCLPWKVAEPA